MTWRCTLAYHTGVHNYNISFLWSESNQMNISGKKDKESARDTKQTSARVSLWFEVSPQGWRTLPRNRALLSFQEMDFLETCVLAGVTVQGSAGQSWLCALCTPKAGTTVEKGKEEGWGRCGGGWRASLSGSVPRVSSRSQHRCEANQQRRPGRDACKGGALERCFTEEMS